MDLQSIVQLISNVGFPIVVAWYCLTKLDTTISKNTEVMNEMVNLIRSNKEVE